MKLVTDQELIAKIDSNKETLEKWDQLFVDLMTRSGYKQEDIDNRYPHKKEGEDTLPNGDKFLESGRIFYKLTDEDKEELKRVVLEWHGKSSVKSLGDTTRAILSSDYFVISSSPIDKFMCATNQPFGSCLSITGCYGHFNLPALFSDSNFLVGYLTKGKHVNFYFDDSMKDNEELKKEYAYKHFKMQTRNFLYRLDNNKLGIGRTYPSVGSNISVFNSYIDKILNNVKINTPTSQEKSEYLRCKQYIPVIKDTYKVPRAVYYDDYKIIDQKSDPRCLFKRGGGATSSYSYFKPTHTVKEFILNRELTYLDLNKNIVKCEHCEEIADTNDMTSIRIPGTYNSCNIRSWMYVCSKCREEKYTYCKVCGEYHLTESMDKLDIDKLGVVNSTGWTGERCRTWIENNTFICQGCGELHSRYDNKSLWQDIKICKKCIKKTHQCAKCGELKTLGRGEFMHLLGNCKTVCPECFSDMKRKAVDKKKLLDLEVDMTEVEQELFLDDLNELDPLGAMTKYKAGKRKPRATTVTATPVDTPDIQQILNTLTEELREKKS